MFKLVKEKMLVTLVVVLLLVMVFGNVKSLATVLRPTNTASSNTNKVVENTVGATNTAGNTTNTNKANAVSSSVGAVNNTSNTSNTSKYSNTNTNKSTSKLPYAGSNSSMVFVVVALVASAIYAYKKVSDYNI